MAGFGDVSAQLTNQPVLMTVPCPLYVPIVNWYARFLDGPEGQAAHAERKSLARRTQRRRPLQRHHYPRHLRHLRRCRLAFSLWPRHARLRSQRRRQLHAGHDRRVHRNLSSPLHHPPGPPLSPHAQRVSPRRILHCIAQVAWTQGDNGKGMPNYSTLVGSAIEDEIGNLYVPGRSTNLPSPVPRATASTSPSTPPTTSSLNSCPIWPPTSTSTPSSSSASSTRSPSPTADPAPSLLSLTVPCKNNDDPPHPHPSRSPAMDHQLRDAIGRRDIPNSHRPRVVTRLGSTNCCPFIRPKSPLTGLFPRSLHPRWIDETQKLLLY